MTYDERIHTQICEKCVFLLYDCVSLRDWCYAFAFEEIMLLCVRANSSSSLSFIIRYALGVSWTRSHPERKYEVSEGFNLKLKYILLIYFYWREFDFAEEHWTASICFLWKKLIKWKENLHLAICQVELRFDKCIEVPEMGHSLFLFSPNFYQRYEISNNNKFRGRYIIYNIDCGWTLFYKFVLWNLMKKKCTHSALKNKYW